MAFQVLKSKIGEDFAEKVESHRQALLAHRFTIRGEGAPRSDEMVEGCVRRVFVAEDKPDDFVADYEIIDDTPPPPPPPTLAQRKNALRSEVASREMDLLNDILPFGKRRLLQLRIGRIADQNKASPEEKTLIARHTDVMQKSSDVHMWAAFQQAEIDDLDEASVESWQMKPFA